MRLITESLEHTSRGAVALVALVLAACGGDGVADMRAAVGMKRVFVTKAVYPPDFGGVAGADRICNTAAESVNLGGQWTAWVSDSTSDAIDRLQGSGPWHLLDGTKAFNNRASLMSTPLVSIRITEIGTDLGDSVWTGTAVGGVASGNHCRNWTSTAIRDAGMAGNAQNNGSGWTASHQPGCNQQSQIYCFER